MTAISFIGLGAMGGPMAANLVRAGHQVKGYDPSENARAISADNGVTICGSAVETVEEAEVVITMLPNGPIVEDVMLRDTGALAAMSSDTVLIDSSSIDVATSRKLHLAAAEADVNCLDAPVSGGIAGASAGTLTFMVGGETGTLDRARPLLEAMGKTIVHVGAPGSGQAAKTCNQMLFGTTLTAVGEMFVLATSLGLDHQVLWNIVTNSTGDCRAIRNFCPVPDVVPGSAADNDYKPGFSSALMLKDLRLALTAAQSVDQELPLAGAAAAAYSNLVQDFGALDCSAVIKAIPTKMEAIK